MTPNEVMSKLAQAGIHRDKRTLNRYARKGLIPKAETKAAGKGKGRIANYPKETPAELYASLKIMMNFPQFKMEDVAKIRKIAKRKDELLYLKTLFAEQLPGETAAESFIFLFVILWRGHYTKFIEHESKGNIVGMDDKIMETVAKPLFMLDPDGFARHINEVVGALRKLELTDIPVYDSKFLSYADYEGDYYDLYRSDRKKNDPGNE